MTPEEFLEHFGVKGMKWGQRRKVAKASRREVKEISARNTKAFNKASKDPTFDREVKATLKGRGITGTNRKVETNSLGIFTNRIKGDFTNSKGEKVSEDFANAVLTKAVQKQDRRKKAVAAGALAIAAGAALAPTILKNSGSRKASSSYAGPFFSARGPKSSIEVGSRIEGTFIRPEILSMLVSSLNG